VTWVRLIWPIEGDTGGSGNLSTSLSHFTRLAEHPKFVLVFNANGDGTIIHNDPVLRQTGKKLLRKGKEIHLCFIDLKKAFDRMRTKKKRYLKVHETKRSRNKYDSN
jgi:hypothetical protein